MFDWMRSSFARYGSVRSTLLAMLMGVTMGAHGQVPDTAPEFIGATQRWLDSEVANANLSGAAPLRMEVSIGNIDSRLRLARCAKVEPYMPAGMRLWGRTRLGIRCVDGQSRWNVFMPVTVKAYGQAWVLKGNASAGAILTEDDVMEAEVDWAEDNSPVITNASQWVGQVTMRPLMAGQALRQGMLRPAQVFQAGAMVRIIAQGGGFQISSDGQALSAGVVGQRTRVRVDNGRVMSALVLDARTVQIEI